MEKNVLYEKIYQELLDKIRCGEYQPGSRLPTEKELEETYHVSRITAKKAMELLVADGCVSRIPGKGSFVNGDSGAEDVRSAVPAKNPVKGEGKRHRMVGVVFDTFTSDFGSELLKGIERECRRRQFGLMLDFTYGSIEEENSAMEKDLALGCQGLILMCAQGEVYNSSILKLSLQGFPMVLVDRKMKGIPIPCVRSDNYQASRELTELLIRNGHRQICFVTHPVMNTSSIIDRYNGFANCIMEHQEVRGSYAEVRSYNPTPIDIRNECQELCYDEMKEIISQNSSCTAFLAVDYRLGRLIASVLHGMMLEREIAVFDSIADIYGGNGSFICVKQEEQLMGKRAVELLEQAMQGRPAKEDVIVPYEIVFPKVPAQ